MLFPRFYFQKKFFAKKASVKGIKELERIYGIQNGGDRKSDGNNFQLKSQTELAEELGIEDRTLRNYKQLAEMIPEMQTLVEIPCFQISPKFKKAHLRFFCHITFVYVHHTDEISRRKPDILRFCCQVDKIYHLCLKLRISARISHTQAIDGYTQI